MNCLVKTIAFLLLLMYSLLCYANDCKNPIYLDNERMMNLSGIVVIKEFYGPPGFGDDKKVDIKYIGYILNLDKPICVYSKSANSDIFENNVIHSVNIKIKYGKKPSDYHFKNGRHVTVFGTVRLAVLPSDETPVVLDVDQ